MSRDFGYWCCYLSWLCLLVWWCSPMTTSTALCPTPHVLRHPQRQQQQQQQHLPRGGWDDHHDHCHHAATAIAVPRPRRRRRQLPLLPNRWTAASVLWLSVAQEDTDQNSQQQQTPPPTPTQKQEQQEQKQQEHDELTADQLDFVLGYLNQHHGDLLRKLAEAFSPLGTEMARANAWSGGSFIIQEARVVHIDRGNIHLSVQVQRRGVGAAAGSNQTVQFALTASPVPERRRYYQETNDVPEDLPIKNGNNDKDGSSTSGSGVGSLKPRLAIDDIVRRLCRLCWIVNMPAVTGKLIQLAIQLNGAGIGKLPDNMYLNQVPHNRYVRQYFYDGAAQAVLEAVIQCSRGHLTNRMQVVSQFPEMNPSMDSYRIGTILEMVRAIAIRLAEENLRVKVCVQASMGVGIFTGVPKQLSGVHRLIQLMDWQSGEGEINDGMVGNYVRFGAIGPDHVMNTQRKANSDDEIVQHQDDVFLLIAPQSMVGTDSSIIPPLMGMVAAAGDRPVILINPDLTDRASAAGQQGVRGRKERIEFAQSFNTVYHFQNIYLSGTSYFPILGAITKLRPTDPWMAHQRRDYLDGSGEIYVPMLASESKPEGEVILRVFDS